MVDLSGKIVLVTGAAGAIGSAVVQAIKQASGTAIGGDLRGKPGIDTVIDVSAEADWQRTAADIERKYGRLDGLVNAAGIVAVGSIEVTEFSAWRHVIERQSRWYISRLQICLSTSSQEGWCNRQSVFSARNGWRTQPCCLFRIEGRRVLAHQIGGTARSALPAARAMQCRLPCIYRRADGR